MVQSERDAGCEDCRVQDVKRTKAFFVRFSCGFFMVHGFSQI